MAEKNRFSKPVAFNKTNPVDQRMLRHVSKRNFSGYVKKLILADMTERENIKRKMGPRDNPIAEIPKTSSERLDQLRETLKKERK